MSRVLRHFAATLSLLFASQICAAQTPNTCSIAGYAFEYVNGMYNTWTDVESGEAALRKALGPTHNGRPIAIESTWNRTDPGLDDLRQAFRQLVNVHPELVDTWFVGILPFVSGTVDEVLQDISDLYLGGAPVPQSVRDALVEWSNTVVAHLARRLSRSFVEAAPSYEADLRRYLTRAQTRLAENWDIILVGHSQGNFFVNEAFSRLLVAQAEGPRRFSALHIATPVVLLTDGENVTSPADKVINAVRLVQPATPQATVNIDPLPAGNDGHVLEHYLTHAVLSAAIRGATNRIFAGIDSTAFSRCPCGTPDPSVLRLPRVCINPAAFIVPGQSKSITEIIAIDPGNDPAVTYVYVGIGFFKDTPSSLSLQGATPVSGLSSYRGREVNPSYGFTAFGTDIYYSSQGLPQPHPARYGGSLVLDASHSAESVSLPLFIAQYQRRTGATSCFGVTNPPFPCFERINFYESAVPIRVQAPR